MISNFIRWALKNRLVVLLIAAGVTAYGLYSVNNTKVDAIPDQYAYVYISGSKRSSLILPVDAVIPDAKGATVRIQTKKNTFKNIMFEVGAEEGSMIEIRRGLQPGDLVVITGAYLLNSEFIFKKVVNPMEGMKM